MNFLVFLGLNLLWVVVASGLSLLLKGIFVGSADYYDKRTPTKMPFSSTSLSPS